MKPHPLKELSLARLREFLREPEAVFWTYGFPLLLAVGLGIAPTGRVGSCRRLPQVLRLPGSDPIGERGGGIDPVHGADLPRGRLHPAHSATAAWAAAILAIGTR